MDVKKYLTTAGMVMLMALPVVATDVGISNDTWATIVNMLPWMIVLIGGFLGLIAIAIPYIFIFVVVGFFKDFLQEILGMFKGILK